MTIIKTEHPVARKKHICEICGCAIEPGTRYFHQVNDYDGFCDFKAHEECVEYVEDRRDPYYDDGCGPDYTDCYLFDDLEDILGSREAAREFHRLHSIHECVKFVQNHENKVIEIYKINGRMVVAQGPEKAIALYKQAVDKPGIEINRLERITTGESDFAVIENVWHPGSEEPVGNDFCVVIPNIQCDCNAFFCFWDPFKKEPWGVMNLPGTKYDVRFGKDEVERWAYFDELMGIKND